MPHTRTDPDQDIIKLIGVWVFLGTMTLWDFENDIRTTLYSIWKMLDTWGVPYSEQGFWIWGRPRKISPEMVESLINLVATRSPYYRDELQYNILTTFQLRVSKETVSRTLKDPNFSRKLTILIVAQGEEAERGQMV